MADETPLFSTKVISAGARDHVWQRMLLEELDPMTLKEFKLEKAMRDKRAKLRNHGHAYHEDPRSATFALFPQHSYDGDPVYRNGVPRMPDELNNRFQQALANHKLKLKQQRINMRLQKERERAIAIENGIDPDLLANKNKMESFQRLAKPRKPWHRHTVGVYPYPKIMAMQNDPQKLRMAVTGKIKTDKHAQQAAVSAGGALDASVIAKSESAQNLLKNVKNKHMLIQDAVSIQKQMSKSTGDLQAALHADDKAAQKRKKRRQQRRHRSQRSMNSINSISDVVSRMEDPATKFRRHRNAALGIVDEPDETHPDPTHQESSPPASDSEHNHRQRRRRNKHRQRKKFNFPKMPTIKDYKVLMKDMYQDSPIESSYGLSTHYQLQHQPQIHSGRSEVTSDEGEQQHLEEETSVMAVLENLEDFGENEAALISDEITRSVQQARRQRQAGRLDNAGGSSLSVDTTGNNQERDGQDAQEEVHMTAAEKLRLQRVLKSPSGQFSGSLAFAKSPVAQERLLKNFGGGENNKRDGVMSSQQDEERHYLGLYEHARHKILNRMKIDWRHENDVASAQPHRAAEDLLHLKVKLALSQLNLANEQEQQVLLDAAAKFRAAQQRAVRVEPGMDVYVAGNAGTVMYVGEVEALGPGKWIGMRLFKKHQQGYPIVEADGQRLKHSFMRIQAMLAIAGDRDVDNVLFTNCFAVRRCGRSLWNGANFAFNNGYWGRYVPALKAALVFRRFLRESQARNCMKRRSTYGKANPKNLMDSYASFVPAHKANGLHYLVGNLTSSFLTTSTIDKVRSCFEWIAYACRFDPSATGKPSKEAANSFKLGEAVLSRKELVFNAEDLSLLFHGMCKELRLKSVRLLGLVRGNGFCKLEQKNVPNQRGLRHYWNAVLVDGRWRLFDVVLSMGSYELNETSAFVEEKKQQQQALSFLSDYSPAYFDTPEQLFSLQHFPLTVIDDHESGEEKHAVSEFRSKRITYEQFTNDSFIDVSRVFVECGVTVMSPSAPVNRFVLKDRHEFKMVLRAPVSLRFDVEMNAPRQVQHQTWFVQYGESKGASGMRLVTIMIVAPSKGEYHASINCRHASLAGNAEVVSGKFGKKNKVAVKWQTALEFTLEQQTDLQCDKHEYFGFLSSVLPKDHIDYDSKFQLVSPSSSRIRLGVGFDCKLLAPVDTHRIVVVNNGRVHELLRTVDASRSFEEEAADPHVIYTTTEEGIQLKALPDMRILYQMNGALKEPFQLLYRFGSSDDASEIQHGRFRVDDTGYFALAGLQFQGFALGDRNLNLKLHTDGGVHIKIEVFLGWDEKSSDFMPLLGVQPDVTVTMRNHVSLWNVVVVFPTSASVRETNYTVTGHAEGMGKIFSLYVTALS